MVHGDNNGLVLPPGGTDSNNDYSIQQQKAGVLDPSL